MIGKRQASLVTRGFSAHHAVLFPADPDRSAPEGKIHIRHPGAILHFGHKLALGAADLSKRLFDTDLGDGSLALVVEDSCALQPDDGVADVGTIDKDRGACKCFVFLHSLRSYRFPRHSLAQVDSAALTATRDPQTPLKTEEPQNGGVLFL